MLVMPDGTVRVLGRDEGGKPAICMIRNDRLAWKFLVRGILGFCESHLDGDWDSPDMTALFVFALRNEQTLTELIEGNRLWRVVEGVNNTFRRNTKRGSKRNIARHYDLGNAFYECWLDHGMTYSAALFGETTVANDRLYEAQENKYASLGRMLDLRADHHLLEIGCGWGGFAEYAARTYGCRVTALTISREQYDYASRRIADAGLADLVDIQFRDYRDSVGTYDRIASIEMFEAVGEKYWPLFFSTLRERLLPGGIAALQVITISDRFFDTYRRGADYIQKYIFPGGLLPTFEHLRGQGAMAKLTWLQSRNFGSHYARTLEEWRNRFVASWSDISKLGFDEQFRRMWEQYLCYCEAGFTTGTIDVHQISLTRPLEA